MDKFTLATLTRLSMSDIGNKAMELMSYKNNEYIEHKDWMEISKVEARASKVKYSINPYNPSQTTTELEALVEEVKELNILVTSASAKVYDSRQSGKE